MLTGGVIGRFIIGPQIGQGAFGKIYAARDSISGLIYAIKYELATADRKTLLFEMKVLLRIHDSPYFPRFFESGETDSLAWIAIEFIGPSLASILRRRPERTLSLSTAIRTAKHCLLALRSLHGLGFVHRDVKPGNILIRATRTHGEPPVCLIDFGLVRIYRDQSTGEHERPRLRTGFRGTRTYASLNAHACADLSRRDDLASWFYVLIDTLRGGLPWKGVTNNVDVAVMKNQFAVREAVRPFSPALYDIWLHISQLKFSMDPDYEFMLSKLEDVMRVNGIGDADEFDWAAGMEEYRRTLASEFGFSPRTETQEEDVRPYYTELGPSPVIMQGIHRASMKSPLVRPQGRNYSVMQQSELNEGDQRQCCC
jgi:serine/threonine protein kinase